VQVLEQEVIESWNQILTNHVRRQRPKLGKAGLNPSEVSYLYALNIGRKAFLCRISQGLNDSYAKLNSRVEEAFADDDLSGYCIATSESILPLRRKSLLAYIGRFEYDLKVRVNDQRVIEVINRLAPAFESEVSALETKKSGEESLRVYVLSNKSSSLVPASEEGELLAAKARLDHYFAHPLGSKTGQ
jgi:hypothetical protein